MTRRVALIGYHYGYDVSLKDRADIELFVVENADAVKIKPNLFTGLKSQNLLICDYQDYKELKNRVIPWLESNNIELILPVYEYSIRAASICRKELGCKGLDEYYANIVTDKYLLRKFAAENKINQKRFTQISDNTDPHKIDLELPWVIKPTKNRASVGVIKIDTIEDYEKALNDSKKSREPKGRELLNKRSYIAEEYIDGLGISVEVLLKDSQTIWSNVTNINAGRNNIFPINHITVPANVEYEKYWQAIRATEELAYKLKISTGILHCEWKYSERWNLIECTTRLPGAFITEAINNSYNINLYSLLIDLFFTNELSINNKPIKYSHVHWLSAPAGKIMLVEGLDQIKENINVFMFNHSWKPDTYNKEYVNGWTSQAYIGLSHKEYNSLISECQKIVGNIRVIYRDSRNIYKPSSEIEHG